MKEKLLLTGGSGGLGTALRKQLDYLYDITTLGMAETDDIKLDLDFDANLDEEPFQDAMHGREPFSAIIHCAGTNHISPLGALTVEDVVHLLWVNAISNFVINRWAIFDAKRKPQWICHVISDAAWTPMTHSLAYNVSKAAQLMVMRQMAHEVKPNPIIFGVSPGKIAHTGMSAYIDKTFPALRGMTIEEGRNYQASRLRTGEMEPQTVAEFIGRLVSCLSVHMHGHNFILGG